MSYYLHNVPGRLRVQTPVIKGKRDIGQNVLESLTPVNGISSTTCNTLTGSIIINYDSELVGPEEILAALQRAGYVDLSKVVTKPSSISGIEVSESSAILAKILLGLCVEKAFERSILSFVAVLL